MKTSQIIFLGLALFLAVQSSAGSRCNNCGLGSGTDACGCSEIVVRASRPGRPVAYADPYVIKEAAAIKSAPVRSGCGSMNQRKISGPSVTDLLSHNCGPIAPRFQPIGDLCTTCKKPIEVVPAYPGKPVCNACAEKSRAYDGAYTDPGSYTSYSSSNADLNAFEDECLSFDEQENIYNAQYVPAAPADPVSLSLAYGLARQTKKPIHEGALSFGPKTTPVDGSVRKSGSDIHEERLLIVDKPVVELMAPRQAVSSATYDEVVAQQQALEEQRLELEAQAEQNSGGRGSSYISFSDLGYGPVTSTGNNFISTVTRQESVASDQGDDSPCGPIGQPIPGYVSGNVIIRGEAGQESASDYYGGDSYEQESYEEDSCGGDSSEESGSYVRSGGLLERLRASARAQTGCGCSH